MVPFSLQFNQLLRAPKTYVAAVLEAAKIYEIVIESIIIVKAEAER